MSSGCYSILRHMLFNRRNMGTKKLKLLAIQCLISNFSFKAESSTNTSVVNNNLGGQKPVTISSTSTPALLHGAGLLPAAANVTASPNWQVEQWQNNTKN